MTDLEELLKNDVEDFIDYNKLENIDFLIKNEIWWKENILKDYNLYLKDNDDEDPEDLEDFDEWKDNYKHEIEDEIQSAMDSYFTAYDTEKFKSEDNHIWDVLTAWWGPTIRLEVETKNENVTWNWYWGSDILKEDISEHYNTIRDIYNLYDNE